MDDGCEMQSTGSGTSTIHLLDVLKHIVYKWIRMWDAPFKSSLGLVSHIPHPPPPAWM